MREFLADPRHHLIAAIDRGIRETDAQDERAGDVQLSAQTQAMSPHLSTTTLCFGRRLRNDNCRAITFGFSGGRGTIRIADLSHPSSGAVMVGKCFRKSTRRALALAAVTLLACGSVLATQQSAIWNGSFNGTWSDAFNWSNGVVPNNTASVNYDVFIDGGKSSQSNPQCSGSFTIDSVTVDQADQLSITSGGSLFVAKSVNLAGRVVVNSGTLALGDGAILGGSGSILLNSGGGSISATLFPQDALTVPSGFQVAAGYRSVVGNPAIPLIDNGTIALTGYGNVATVQASLLTNNSTMTAPTNLGYFISAQSVVNNGTLRSTATQSFESGGTFLITCGSLTNSGLISVDHRGKMTCTGAVTNIGTIQTSTVTAVGPSTFAASSALNNLGTILVNSGGAVFLNGGFTNSGTILVNGGTLGLGSDVDRSALAAITVQSLSSTLAISGTFHNAGQDLLLNSSTVNWALDGGTIAGGTLSTADGKSLQVVGSGTLDGTIINGMIYGLGQLVITNNDQINTSGEFDGSGLYCTGPLEIGKNFTANCNVGTFSQPTVNHGLIINRGTYLEVIGSTIKNDGIIQNSSFGSIEFHGTYSMADLGTIENSGNGALLFGGTIENSGHTLSINSTTDRDYLTGTIHGGTLEITAGNTLSTDFEYGAGLDGCWLNGHYQFGGQYGRLLIGNGILNGDGDVSLGPSSLDGPSRMISSTASLTVGAGMTVHGGGGFLTTPQTASGIGDSTHNVPLLNHGTILADLTDQSGWAGEFDIVAPTITNDGVLGVRSGALLDAFGDVTFVSGGQLDVELSTTAGRGMILVNGALDLSDTGDVLSITPGSVPFGTSVKIASATGGVLGQFDVVTPGYKITYTTTDVFARAVPEPVSFGMLLLALAHVARRTKISSNLSRPSKS